VAEIGSWGSGRMLICRTMLPPSVLGFSVSTFATHSGSIYAGWSVLVNRSFKVTSILRSGQARCYRNIHSMQFRRFKTRFKDY